jgi:hypothetical protein
VGLVLKTVWFDKKVLILIEKVNKNYRLSINRGQLFGSEIDFSQLVKIYGNTEESQIRYSPAQCIGTEKIKINGNPEKESVSTSYDGLVRSQAASFIKIWLPKLSKPK